MSENENAMGDALPGEPAAPAKTAAPAGREGAGEGPPERRGPRDRDRDRDRGGARGRGDRRMGGRRRWGRGKVCAMCVEKMNYVDYKDVKRLRRFMSDRAKILSRRVSGACAKHQRMISHAIHRARVLALLPYKA
ncbi:MAG: 30S ribosomal protein S18 [Candidatus Sumerlaeota bacterium]|nr:30S ribosomal protein S18 [Candidatus Sumerlaeota bacterium]